ncbi:MAG: WG repeat-containing protein [Peptococcaceae bacterium]|nr:WG repeat-containing protein [Peptococcaceae bacterium]
MKNPIPLLTAILVMFLVTGCTGGLEQKEPLDKEPLAKEPLDAALVDYTWIVEPKLDYIGIYYHPGRCSTNYSDEDGTFFAAIASDDPGWIISTETGETIEPHFGHGYGGDVMLVYDPEKGKYGVITAEDPIGTLRMYDNWSKAVAAGIGNKGLLFPVQEIKITKEDVDPQREIYFHGEDLAYPNAGNYISEERYAVADKDGLLTDFVYSAPDRHCINQYSPHITESLPMEVDGKWGFVGTDGKYVIEPIFEDAVSIDHQRAFVCWDGKWGILRIDA